MERGEWRREAQTKLKNKLENSSFTCIHILSLLFNHYLTHSPSLSLSLSLSWLTHIGLTCLTRRFSSISLSHFSISCKQTQLKILQYLFDPLRSSMLLPTYNLTILFLFNPSHRSFSAPNYSITCTSRQYNTKALSLSLCLSKANMH